MIAEILDGCSLILEGFLEDAGWFDSLRGTQSPFLLEARPPAAVRAPAPRHAEESTAKNL